jgi:hypothetical protein
MSASGRGRIALVAAVAVAAVSPALAQHVVLDAPGLVQRNAPPPPPVRAAPTVWPRLDPGAVLCNTVDDLDRHAANMTARVSGGGTLAADCRIITQPTGIQIISREGLGRTQVRVKGPGSVSGWTDAWLPDKAPPSR